MSGDPESMDFKNLLITGGAGFVGSNLALLFREARPELGVTVLDSLKRRGSELNLPRLRAAGVEFRHGDIRSTDDFDDLPPYDLMIDCSAEPSVQAGLEGSPRAVLDTNLVGTINCLEAARSPRRRVPVPEHQPRLSDRGLERPALHGNRDAVPLGRHAGNSRILETRESPRASRSTGRGRSTGRASWPASN